VLLTTDSNAYESSIVENNYGGISNGQHYVKRYGLTVSNSHTIPAGYQLLDGWKRDAPSTLPNIISSTNLVPNVTVLPNEVDVELNSFTSTSATMTGYIYEIVEQNLITGNWDNLGWYPFDLTDTADFAYSLYVEMLPVSVEEKQQSEFNMFPNPANETVTITLSNISDGSYSIVLSDITGKIVRSISEERGSIINERIVFSTKNIAAGMYFVTISLQDSKISKKLVISR